MPTPEGHLYLTRSYKSTVKLPGLILHFYKDPEPLQDDALLFGNLKASGLARAYLENLQRTKVSGEESKTLSREQLEEKIEAFLRVKGEAALNQVRDRAKEITPQLEMEKEFTELNQLITDLLGTGLSKNLVSPIARARVLGEPIDPDRIQLFESLYGELVKKDYPDYPDKTRVFNHIRISHSSKVIFPIISKELNLQLRKPNKLSRLPHLYLHAMKTHTMCWALTRSFLTVTRCLFYQPLLITY